MSEDPIDESWKIAAEMELYEDLSEDEHGFPEADIRDLLTREDFAPKLVEAVMGTLGFKDGDFVEHEHGFLGYRARFEKDDAIYLSPVFEGEEHQIDLPTFSDEFLAQSGLERKSIVFQLHTHPSTMGLLSDVVFRRSKEHTNRHMLRFSEGDLKNLIILAEREDSALIQGVAVHTGKRRGQLLLANFRSWDALQDFDPRVVYSRQTTRLRAGADPYEAYREAGLNVAVVKFDMRTGQLDKKDVDRATKILSQRE